MFGNKGHRRYNRHRNDKSKPTLGDRGREVLEQIDENNKTIQLFREYATELDTKHDRYERIVKLSRDITIESKRIIFLLHNVDKENKRESILKEAGIRLNQLVSNNFKLIALELEGLDAYQYLRAYTAGLQEFVEALTFYEYLLNNNIDGAKKVQDEFTYVISSDEKDSAETDSAETVQEELSVVPTTRTIITLVPISEYILGLADLTGELMRKCINNLGSGNVDDCFLTCNFVKELYKGFLQIGNTQGHKEIGRKLYVLKQSLMKMELVCYNIRVRGSEVPKHMLANVLNTNDASAEEDEGYF